MLTKIDSQRSGQIRPSDVFYNAVRVAKAGYVVRGVGDARESRRGVLNAASDLWRTRIEPPELVLEHLSPHPYLEHLSPHPYMTRWFEECRNASPEETALLWRRRIFALEVDVWRPLTADEVKEVIRMLPYDVKYMNKDEAWRRRLVELLPDIITNPEAFMKRSENKAA